MAANCASVLEIAQPRAVDSFNVASVERTRRFRVILNAASATGADTALVGNDGTNSVPAFGAAYAVGSSLALLSKSAELVSPSTNRKAYDVTCTYTNPTATGTNVSQDPWDRAFLFDYGEVRYTVDLLKDAANTEIKNKAGDLFARPIRGERTNTLITIRFAKKTTDFTYATIAALRGTLNDANFNINGTTYAAKKLRFLSVTAAQSTWVAPGTGTETAYYNINIQIEVAVDYPFDPLTVANVGFNQLVSGTKKRITVPYLNADGTTPPNDPKTGKPPQVPCSEPQWLDANGAVTTTATYIDFHPYTATSWSALSAL